MKSPFKGLWKSMERTFASLDEMFEDIDKDLKSFELDVMNVPVAEKTVTVEETREGGVVTKTVTRTVIQSRRKS